MQRTGLTTQDTIDTAMPTKSQYQITSIYNLHYSDHSSLNTLDLHFPSYTASPFAVWLLYIHGGAFRDPLKTSTTILPTLPTLFDPASPHYVLDIYAVASINYRLSPYPSHPTLPSSPDDPSRSSVWPDHLNDVMDAIHWVLDHGQGHDPRSGQDDSHSNGSKDYILAGHSVGGTMTLKICQADNFPFHLPIAALSLSGIYDFVALRDAHQSTRKIYDELITAALGPEEGGGWNKGSTTKEAVQEAVRLVVLAHSKTDRLVEWAQIDKMAHVLRNLESEGRALKMELYGDHDEIHQQGIEIARAVAATVRMLKNLR